MSAAHTEEAVARRCDERRSRLPGAPAGGSVAASGVTTAVLLATAPADDGGPAAGLAWRDETVLARLVAQLGDLGVRSVHVITRPAWADELAAGIPAAGRGVRVEASPDVAGDLRALADVARAAPAGIMVAYADIVTHREALAGLLADPRIATGILTGARRRTLAFRVRTARGRVVSAASPHHAVHRPNATFLGVLKVSARDRTALADAAQRLEQLLASGLPAGWDEELQRKADGWRTPSDEALEAAADGRVEEPLAPVEPESDRAEADAAAAAPADEAEVERRLAVVREDVASMLLVALVRSDVHLTAGYLRSLFWARPVSREALAQATEELAGYDEDRVLLESAVKGRDGFFTTFFVSPYSKYIARWAARRGWTPNAVTTVSMAIGLLAAAAFATGERAGLVAGAVLLQVAFTTDCVDGQLARYTRQFSKLGAWLDSIFDRSKEYAVFAGLAIGASAMGDPVWLLAGAAVILQTARHMFDFSYAAGQHQVIGATVHPPLEEPFDRVGGRPPAPPPGPAPVWTVPVAPPRPLVRELPVRALRFWRRFDRLPAVAWIKRMIAFPIGERFAAISITAAVATPRTTFVVVLAWGGLAAVYTLTGRLLRSLS